MRQAIVCTLALVSLVTGCDEVFDLEHLTAVDAAAGDAPAANALVAWYPMENIANSTLDDIVGDHDGACVPTQCPTVVKAMGVIGSALAFDGIAQLVTVTGSPELATTSGFTVALWVHPDQIASDAGSCPVNKRFGTVDDNSWQLCAIGGVWTLFAGAVRVEGVPVEYSTWHHLAATWDATTRALWLYTDGVALGQPAAADVEFDDGKVVFGGDIDAASVVARYMGALDEIRIYERALGPQEIAALSQLR